MARVPTRYIPDHLSKADKSRVRRELRKSRRQYKKGKFYTRKKVKSFKPKKSRWIEVLRRKYKIPEHVPLSNTLLSKKTGCSKKTLKHIIKKGKGAYFSSGSRPNQTATSWGKARLYSSLSGGPASRIDLHLLETGCKPTSKALRMARRVKAEHVRSKRLL